MHLILTGFMASGKTTIGKMLAQHLRLPFVDLDERWTRQTGLSPQFYIPRFGVPAFRRLEKRLLQGALSDQPSVIATGGGAVLDPLNRRRMLAKGWVVWLKVPPRLLWQRLAAGRSRPLLPPGRNYQQFYTLYARRIPCYRQCHFCCDRAADAPETVAISILNRYKEARCTPNC